MSAVERNGVSYEIERKYLIHYPDEAQMALIPGAYYYDIEQIYLTKNADGDPARIRMRRGASCTEYFYTVKTRVSDVTRVENERNITAGAYNALKDNEGENPLIISKRRWCLPHAGKTVEVDLFPFWSEQAIAEVELENERETVLFPDCVNLVREVTHEKKFTNRALAVALRDGEITESGYMI